MSTPYNPETEGAEMSFSDKMSYGDYLKLDQILTAQELKTSTHDELLFIIQHQVSELWLRLAIHELNAARTLIAQNEGDVRPAFKMLTRVARIFEQLNSAWDVLRTMTPSEYTAFRDDLGESSGFQSHQYRLIEFILGNRNEAMLKPHEHVPESHALLLAELSEPSLYDEVLRALARQGHNEPAATLERDVSQPHAFSQEVQNMWEDIYRNPRANWMAYELAEKLVDMEDYFRRWRFNHVTTVERIIGSKRGTGGTGGVSYLQRMLKVELFPELWAVRTVL
ncbi:MAG: tryptophan 2,3-dioxygenase [Hyphomicrobiales bacterium]